MNQLAMATRTRHRHRAAEIAVWTCAIVLGAAVAVGAPPRAAGPSGPASGKRTIVDPAVVPAGGVHCQHCGRVGCRLQHGHVGDCRDGMCAPHCPVRPGEYGFYRTQWRRWPGQGVVPASAEEAATPARPPASQVPTIEEESPRLPDDALDPADGRLPSDPIPEEPVAEPVVEPKPEADKPAKPAAPPADDVAPVPPTPPGEPPAKPVTEPGDAGLFDQSATPPASDEPIESGTMRYPAQVGRSLAAGTAPWRLEPAARQRAVASDRGL